MPHGVHVGVHEGVLTMRGEKKSEREEKEEKRHDVERSYGAFTLPQNADADRVEARFDNGVLAVTIGKTQESKPRTVDGRPAEATITCASGVYDPFCAGEDVTITLASPPAATGMHAVQNPQGPTSNELPVCVGSGRPDCL